MNLRSDRENSASPKTPISGVRFLALESVCLFKYSKRKAGGPMYREKRPAKYLEDLNVYTKRQINILYFNGYGRDPTDKELKDLLAKADAQDDFENIQFILNNYNCDRIDDNEDDDYDDSPSEPPAPKEEIDALFDEIRASCVGPVKPQNPNPRNHFYRKSR